MLSSDESDSGSSRFARVPITIFNKSIDPSKSSSYVMYVCVYIMCVCVYMYVCMYVCIVFVYLTRRILLSVFM